VRVAKTTASFAITHFFYIGFDKHSKLPKQPMKNRSMQ